MTGKTREKKRKERKKERGFVVPSFCWKERRIASLSLVKSLHFSFTSIVRINDLTESPFSVAIILIPAGNVSILIHLNAVAKIPA